MRETIVFIHGLTGSKQAFRKQIAYLADSYNTYVYDLLGHGEDRGKAVDFTLKNLVKQLEDFFEEKGIERAHICSLSYGCYPSTIFANKWQDKVLSLCFIGGHYNSPSPLRDIFQQYWDCRNEPYPLWLKKYSHAIYPKDGLIDPYSIVSNKVYYKYGLELHKDILRDALEHRLNYDLRSDLASLTLPVLWVMGDHDSLYKSSLRDLDQVIPHVVYSELKHAGHAANLFQPNCFKEVYGVFLGDFSSVNPRYA
ncbi:alpha/beta fold hydrolase [Metabacillus herbersteinensis]|uniref:Alpha/beta fold hydrolase n=1 Tax=Metabacillus herbersteinensis TaxID=283816 RepID=A0ABV6GGB1_9BACI